MQMEIQDISCICGTSFHRLSRFKKHIVICSSKRMSNTEDTIANYTLDDKLNEKVQNQTQFGTQNNSNSSANTCNLDQSESSSERNPIDLLESCNALDTFSNMSETISNFSLYFLLELHAKSNFCRTDVILIQKLVSEFLLNISRTLFNNFEKGISTPDKALFRNILDLISNPFKNIDSEHLLLKKLKDCNLLKEPKQFLINEEVGVVYSRGENDFNSIETRGILMPIEFQFEKFLQHKIHEMVKNKIKYSKDPPNRISHFIQGKTWRRIENENSTGDLLIPVGLYSDGVQFNNSLGPHTESNEMFYYYFPLLDNPLSLENLQLASIVKTLDTKNFGNSKCFAPMVDTFEKLGTTGIELEINGEKLLVKFILIIISGDNLAVNSLLGFSKSFSANHFCRFCVKSKDETKTLCVEDKVSLRDPKNYLEGLALKFFRETGLMENLIFNNLSYFHCCNNKSVDIMHDFYEGICHYDLCNIILYFIQKNCFTLDQLNNRISSFPYNKYETQYIPKIITIEKLKSNSLKMTAREMMSFVNFFGLMVGDLIEIDDPAWILYITLLKILDILMSSHFYPGTLDLLRNLIANHNQYYLNLFGCLKPKMHIATHYITCIEEFGPPRQYMSFRCESKHKEFKAYANAISCRKNLLLSLAAKYQLLFSYQCLRGWKDNQLDVSKQWKISSAHTSVFPEFAFFNSFYKIIFKGTVYEKGMYLLIENENTLIYEIDEIWVHISEEIENIKIVCSLAGMCIFNSHLESYTIDRQLLNTTPNLFPLDKFKGLPIHIYKLKSGIEATRPKFFF